LKGGIEVSSDENPGGEEREDEPHGMTKQKARDKKKKRTQKPKKK